MTATAGDPQAAGSRHYALVPGTPVTMSPTGSPGVQCLAEILAWSASPSGLVVTARAVTDPGSATTLDNRTVFVTGRTPDEALVVLEAVARSSPGRAGLLELVSVAGLAREHRRAAVRAAVALPVVVAATEPAGADPPDPVPVPGTTVSGTTVSGTTVSGTTVDLSGEGCRLRLTGERPLPVGTDVVTLIDLGGPRPVRVAGVVVRAAAGDPGIGGPGAAESGSDSEVIISFHPMTSEDAAAIDATVYAALRA